MGAAGAVVLGGDDGEELGGEEGVTGEQEVLSGDWTVPGLARLGLGEGGGVLGPLTGVATTSAPASAVTASAAWSGNSLSLSLDPQILKVSRQLFKSRMTFALKVKLAPTNPSRTVWTLVLICPMALILCPPIVNL